MLRSLTELEGYSLIATDGDLGHCRDFLFDDETWTVRYMVANTGPWLLGRKVLVSPAFIEQPRWESRGIPLTLKREQIEECPPLDTDAPVSRRYEQAYHDFFATPYYWMGNGLWGNYGYPGLMVPTPSAEQIPNARLDESPDETHLRSLKEVTGYRLRAHDDNAGHLTDAIVDDQSWAIRFLVLDTSYLPFSKKLLIATEWITEVSWIDRELRIDVSAEQLEDAPEFDPSTPVNEAQETVLYDYFGRPRASVSGRDEA